MKPLVLLILVLMSINAFSQRKVSGTILDEDDEPVAGATIREVGTDNHTESGINGEFGIITLKDTCVLDVSMLGFREQLLKVTGHTVEVIRLRFYNYTSRWITVGTNYDFVNSKLGIQVSNGYDEKPLTHFEDFSDRFLYKASFHTDFGNEYGFGGTIGWSYPVKYINLLSVGYNKVRYSEKKKFDYQSINLAVSGHLGFIGSNIILNTGFQHLNGRDNIGFGLGLQKVLLYDRMYSGVSAGYYFDYWTYTVYIQGFVYKKMLGMRLSYDKIDRSDFLTLGINFSFNTSVF